MKFDTEYIVEVPYTPPDRDLKSSDVFGIRWRVDLDDPVMLERANKMLLLDPALPPEDALYFAYEQWNGFLCSNCGTELVSNGQNGAGTPSLLCNECGKRPSMWNVFELIVWKYKKVMTALHHYVLGGSAVLNSHLFGVGEGLLNEMRMNIPTVKYSHNGPSEVIEYNGKKYGVINQDMVYKGRKGVMLGVSGGLSVTEIGNESTCEGLDSFFDELEENVGTENYIFVMDMRMTVAKMVIERFRERAIVVLQSHSTWGDVHVYFYREGWYTLRLRTDAFSEPSVKRSEEDLLGVGEIELYKGLKGINPRLPLRDMNENYFKKRIKELTTQIKNVEWEKEGRVDLVMRTKFDKLNSLIKELQRRKIDTTVYTNRLRNIIEGLVKRYASEVGRVMKRKIVNAWRPLTVMKKDVEYLSEEIVKEPLPEKPPKKEEVEKKKKPERLSVKPKLVYRGRMDSPVVPREARWIMGLLKLIFQGKEITNNLCEGRFGNIGMALRQGRSMYLDRALTKVHLQSQDVGTTLNWLVQEFPMKDLGKRGERRKRARILEGESYKIKYRDRLKNVTVRVIDVIQRKKKVIKAHCHLRNESRTFKRTRIQEISQMP